MSKSPSNSRSPTPTPADPFASINQETAPQRAQSTGVCNDSFTLRPILPAATPNFESSSRGQSRPIRLIESDSSDPHMTKRIRISNASKSDMQPGPPQHPHDYVASSSTSSTTDAQDEQTMTSQNPPPKKKRTRTLTTPHQAMVLHQLLAQSRFPTTAMREEVGRSIGLSARKVQIWFQNQRQKLRRPRSQSEANTSRPQYGAFPSVPPPAGTHASFSAHPEENSFQLGQPASSSSQPFPCASTSVSTPESYSSLSDTPSQLLGPGVPGLELHPRVGLLAGSSSNISLPQIGHFDASYSATGPSRLIHQSPSPASPTRGPHLPRPLSFPSHFSDAYRTLPPLAPGSLTSAGISQSRAPAQSSAGQLYFTETVAQPIAMDRPFIHYRPGSPRVSGTPRISAGGSSVAPGFIPPPFTLQPSPQWDDRSFTPLLVRPSVWSPPSSSNGSVSPTQSFSVPATLPPLPSSVSTLNQRRAATEEMDPISEQTYRNTQPRISQTPPLQTRIGRYDPVRATIIPFSNSLPLSQSPPSPPSDVDHMEDSS